MSPESRFADPVWRATAVAGLALLGGLAIALLGGSHAVLALSVAAAGLVVTAFVLAPPAAAALHRSPSLLVAGAVLVVGLAALGLGVVGLGLRWLPADFTGMGWIWRLFHAALFPLALMSLAAVGGLVLIADALRARMGLGSQRRAPWRQLTGGARDRVTIPWGAIAGVLLVGWAAFLGIGLAARFAGSSPLVELLVLAAIVGGAVVAIGTPLLIAAATRVDREQAVEAHEEQRQRFAAHLHDSVLQTLALIQRQAHDPVAVARLARRQESSLRAWMAGEAERPGETIVAGLRDVVAEVEDEQGIAVELTAIGDRPIDPAGEALVAAAREALRNAARHAGTGKALVFAELSPARVEVFVRDDGVGFDPTAVAGERRGIRDAIVGRMAAVGGRASIESTPGEGTEVALSLGAAR